MRLEKLSTRESKIVGDVLWAAADGPFFPDWEFDTIFGLKREEVRQVAKDWPLPILPPDIVQRAVNSSFNNLLGYPHRKQDIWSEWISANEATVKRLYDKLWDQSR